MVRAHVTLTALKTRGEDVSQRELVLDLIHSLHVPHDLDGAVVHQTGRSSSLLLGGCVGNLSCEA